MDEQTEPTHIHQVINPQVLTGSPRLPIREDSSLRVSDVSDGSGRKEIESVKAIYRPPELLSQPIKGYWIWIWVLVVAVVILGGACLVWYFTNHHVASAAAAAIVPAAHHLVGLYY